MPVDPFTAKIFEKIGSAVSEPIKKHIVQVYKQRGSEQGLPSTVPEFREALDVLSGGEGIAAHIASFAKALASDAPAAFRDVKLQRWVRSPEAQSLIEKAAFRVVLNKKPNNGEKIKALKLYESINSDSYLRADRHFDDAVRFLVLCLYSTLLPSDKFILYAINESRDTVIDIQNKYGTEILHQLSNISALKLIEKPNKASKVFNYDPSSGQQRKELGERPCPMMPGKVTFVKWQDPGGPKYGVGLPYHVPNRVIAAYNQDKNRVHWWEYNLTSINSKYEEWKSPSHFWIDVIRDFPALGGNRPGTILGRIDATPMRDINRNIVIFQIFIPDDLRSKDEAEYTEYMYLRRIVLPDGSKFEPGGPLIDDAAFEKYNFPIQQVVRDPSES